jgi:arginine decarboxylase-like protein
MGFGDGFQLEHLDVGGGLGIAYEGRRCGPAGTRKR